RREKLDKIKELGIDPYPPELFPVNDTAKHIKEEYREDTQEHFNEISISGRVMSVRVMRKASLAVLQDATGRIQLYVRRDDICPGEDKTMYNKLWKKLLDIGDIIGVTGFAFVTKTGE